jgi:hypothetical protein
MPPNTTQRDPQRQPNAVSELDKLLIGSQEMIVLPTGELVPKGQANQGRGTEIPKHHFYSHAEETAAQEPIIGPGLCSEIERVL